MLKPAKIYLDHNATTPVHEQVLEKMLPYFTQNFANPHSDHAFGWDASEALEQARKQVANLINARASEITFTSGATEAANLALFGFAKENRNKGQHIISCRTEHKAVLETLNALEKDGYEIGYVEVNCDGIVDLEQFQNLLRPDTSMVVMMLANNETGVIQDISEISKLAHQNGSLVMSDITQAVGKIEVDIKAMGIDIAIFSSHKIYGPKGAGAFYSSSKTDLARYMYGGNQENGMRPGTVNVPAVVGFGFASELASKQLQETSEGMLLLRNDFEEQLQSLEDVQINAKDQDRLPNTTSLSVHNVDGDALYRRMNRIAISRGSACTSNVIEASHVLTAMGIEESLALATYRISLGKSTTRQDLNLAFENIKTAINSIRKTSLV
ncbi:cysteine desulfurase [Gramella sp. Hel_I_59]|uniref:cysteine desulfurase family protein n=1 Tax=Gramella sp. Hel_I_59 TaxID=1249978 RepID=UPI0011533F47|nr:cysteine desulfurase family protein [Gramella sp. Hel_I_59]TQI70476.1 cysteine desulfurase [Gramella sp. Hel_I_59]